jgi:hypothetical protein
MSDSPDIIVNHGHESQRWQSVPVDWKALIGTGYSFFFLHCFTLLLLSTAKSQLSLSWINRKLGNKFQKNANNHHLRTNFDQLFHGSTLINWASVQI